LGIPGTRFDRRSTSSGAPTANVVQQGTDLANKGGGGDESDEEPLIAQALKALLLRIYNRALRLPQGRLSAGSITTQKGTPMPKVVLTHAVVDIDRWLKGKAERAAVTRLPLKVRGSRRIRLHETERVALRDCEDALHA
jgi:hypothetical protein